MTVIANAQDRRRASKEKPATMPIGAGRWTAMIIVSGIIVMNLFVYAALPHQQLALLLPALLLTWLMVLLVRNEIRDRKTLIEARVRGLRAMVVYSEDTQWKRHIEEAWFPRLGENVARLNFTERSTWKPSLETRIFRSFVSDWIQPDFTPSVVVFPRMEEPLVFRFDEAVRQARAGRPWYLEELEAEMFGSLE